MNKHKLVIASVLKPVDDTRMFEKFGLSLGQTNKYEINIIGFYIKKLPKAENITFHPIFNFKRLHISRLAAPFKCFRKYLQLKPEVIIVNTHELLTVTALYKILFGVKIIYDIQENYYRNILYTNSFPLLLRPLVAGYIRGKEYVSRLFFDHYFLAERQYESEFSFSRGRSTIIENKYRPLPGYSALPPAPKKPGCIRLLFSGTLAESTGVFEAINIARALHSANPQITLCIMGYCSMSATYHRLVKAIENYDFITLHGGQHLVSHQDIIAMIKSADFGIIYYPWNRSTMNTMPTKLFEYLGNRLPILLQNHEPWMALCETYQACISLEDIDHLDARQLLSRMETKKFYTSTPQDEILWTSEEKKLIKVVEKISL